MNRQRNVIRHAQAQRRDRGLLRTARHQKQHGGFRVGPSQSMRNPLPVGPTLFRVLDKDPVGMRDRRVWLRTAVQAPFSNANAPGFKKRNYVGTRSGARRDQEGPGAEEFLLG